MKQSTILKTKICREKSDEFNKEFFSYKGNKFISHVDTFYFVVFPDCEIWNEDTRKIEFFGALRNAKEIAEITKLPCPIFESVSPHLETRPFVSAQMYAYHFGIRDTFDFFACEFLPQMATPPIMVQIRSNSLWLDGLKNSFDKACDCLERIFDLFGMSIKSVQENRLDYAYHTNYIQNLLNFFPFKNLKKMQISDFKRGGGEFYFKDDETIMDYFCLGRRKSNNVFMRIYDKSKEVVEMGYKQFFQAMWLDKGLISKYDEFLLSHMFDFGSYFAKDKARCLFYSVYGEDFELREEINDMFRHPDVPMSAYTKMADGLVPDLTTVVNVEFQTKRKFYYRLIADNKLKRRFALGSRIKNKRYRKKYALKKGEDKYYRDYMYDMFKKISSITDFLTGKTIRFVKYKGKFGAVKRNKRPTADWWVRLRACRHFEYADEEKVNFFRDYQRNLDLRRMKTLMINKAASFTAYSGSYPEFTIRDDFNDILAGLNDNDIQRYYIKRDKNVKELDRRLGR